MDRIRVFAIDYGIETVVAINPRDLVESNRAKLAVVASPDSIEQIFHAIRLSTPVPEGFVYPDSRIVLLLESSSQRTDTVTLGKMYMHYNETPYRLRADLARLVSGVIPEPEAGALRYYADSVLPRVDWSGVSRE